MEHLNSKTGMGGMKGKEEGEDRRGNEGNRVEGAAARPLASAEQGENRAEGHDPRPSAPSTAQLVDPELAGAGQPVADPFVGQVEHSTAAMGPGPAERVLRSASMSRPGPRSSKIRKGLEKEEELLDTGRRSRSDGRDRSGRSDDRDRSGSRSRDRDGKEIGKEKREKRRREMDRGDREAACPRPGGSGYDTADDVGMDVLGPEDDAGCESSSLMGKPGSDRSWASAPPETERRKRGRPPTTGEYVGLRKAKAEMAEAKERLLRLAAEEEVLQSGIYRQRGQRRRGVASGEMDPGAAPPV